MEVQDCDLENVLPLCSSKRERDKSRRSSILKLTGLPLEDIDANSVEEKRRSKDKAGKRSSGRRVSFADKLQIKEFLADNHWKHGTTDNPEVQSMENSIPNTCSMEQPGSEYGAVADEITGLLFEGGRRRDDNVTHVFDDSNMDLTVPFDNTINVNTTLGNGNMDITVGLDNTILEYKTKFQMSEKIKALMTTEGSPREERQEVGRNEILDGKAFQSQKKRKTVHDGEDGSFPGSEKSLNEEIQPRKKFKCDALMSRLLNKCHEDATREVCPELCATDSAVNFPKEGNTKTTGHLKDDVSSRSQCLSFSPHVARPAQNEDFEVEADRTLDETRSASSSQQEGMHVTMSQTILSAIPMDADEDSFRTQHSSTSVLYKDEAKPKQRSELFGMFRSSKALSPVHCLHEKEELTIPKSSLTNECQSEPRTPNLYSLGCDTSHIERVRVHEILQLSNRNKDINLYRDKEVIDTFAEDISFKDNLAKYIRSEGTVARIDKLGCVSQEDKCHSAVVLGDGNDWKDTDDLVHSSSATETPLAKEATTLERADSPSNAKAENVTNVVHVSEHGSSGDLPLEEERTAKSKRRETFLVENKVLPQNISDDKTYVIRVEDSYFGKNRRKTFDVIRPITDTSEPEEKEAIDNFVSKEGTYDEEHIKHKASSFCEGETTFVVQQQSAVQASSSTQVRESITGSPVNREDREGAPHMNTVSEHSFHSSLTVAPEFVSLTSKANNGALSGDEGLHIEESADPNLKSSSEKDEKSDDSVVLPQTEICQTMYVQETDKTQQCHKAGESSTQSSNFSSATSHSRSSSAYIEPENEPEECSEEIRRDLKQLSSLVVHEMRKELSDQVYDNHAASEISVPLDLDANEDHAKPELVFRPINELYLQGKVLKERMHLDAIESSKTPLRKHTNAPSGSVKKPMNYEMAKLGSACHVTSFNGMSPIFDGKDRHEVQRLEDSADLDLDAYDKIDVSSIVEKENPAHEEVMVLDNIVSLLEKISTAPSSEILQALFTSGPLLDGLRDNPNFKNLIQLFSNFSSKLEDVMDADSKQKTLEKEVSLIQEETSSTEEKLGDVQKERRQCELLEQELATLQGCIETQGTTLAEMMKEIQQRRCAIDSLKSDCESAQGDVEGSKSKLAEVQGNISKYENILREQSKSEAGLEAARTGMTVMERYLPWKLQELTSTNAAFDFLDGNLLLKVTFSGVCAYQVEKVEFFFTSPFRFPGRVVNLETKVAVWNWVGPLLVKSLNEGVDGEQSTSIKSVSMVLHQASVKVEAFRQLCHDFELILCRYPDAKLEQDRISFVAASEHLRSIFSVHLFLSVSNGLPVIQYDIVHEDLENVRHRLKQKLSSIAQQYGIAADRKPKLLCARLFSAIIRNEI